MYIDESIRLKPIRAYLSFISIMSLYNNDLYSVEQVSKSAGTQQTRHAMKGNHCYMSRTAFCHLLDAAMKLPLLSMCSGKTMVCHYIITCILQRMNKVTYHYHKFNDHISHKILSHTTSYYDCNLLSSRWFFLNSFKKMYRAGAFYILK